MGRRQQAAEMTEIVERGGGGRARGLVEVMGEERWAATAAPTPSQSLGCGQSQSCKLLLDGEKPRFGFK